MNPLQPTRTHRPPTGHPNLTSDPTTFRNYFDDDLGDEITLYISDPDGETHGDIYIAYVNGRITITASSPSVFFDVNIDGIPR